MRRQHRLSGGGPFLSQRASQAGIHDPLVLIRAYESESNPSRPVRPSPLAASTIQGLPLDLLDRLRSFPLFEAAPDSFLATIAHHLRPQLYQPQDNILNEGDDGRAIYWLVRGAVRVTSRDGESTYAELKPGAFFGEIGVLMDMPRTATIQAKLKSLVVRLQKEDLQKALVDYPEIERAIRDEAKERLAILERKKKERHAISSATAIPGRATPIKRSHDGSPGDVEMGDTGELVDGQVVSNKRRKSPIPDLGSIAVASTIAGGNTSIRQILKELPLFRDLPPEILHFLGLNAQPRSYAPFTEILQQGSVGREVYFIVSGEVEVLTDRGPGAGDSVNGVIGQRNQRAVARLKPGQYFGEVASLMLAPRRTATIRSVTSVECLVISNDILENLWDRVPHSLRKEVEAEAISRLRAANERDHDMIDVDVSDMDVTPPISQLAIADRVKGASVIADRGNRASKNKATPTIITLPNQEDEESGKIRGDERTNQPYDPDPFLNLELDSLRSRSRRSSLAPPSPDQSQSQGNESPIRQIASPVLLSSPLKPKKHIIQSPTERLTLAKRPKTIHRRPSRFSKGTIPDNILIKIFSYLSLTSLMRLRLVSTHWHKILSSSPELLHHLDLSQYNRLITDAVLIDKICPFVGPRPRHVNISNCFHVTDDGFTVLAATCGEKVRSWKMKSVWDVTGQAVLELVARAKGLEELDLSNCRKVGDNLLARVIGWVVPDLSVLQQQQQQQAPPGQPELPLTPQSPQPPTRRPRAAQQRSAEGTTAQPITPGTVIGCAQLKSLTLSYCKHVTDRSMAHLAVHASSRLEQLDLTRCTTISDQGFQHWTLHPFPNLKRLCLADCTYLSDQAIVALTNAARGLRELDLSFCCALSDVATEVLALGCPSLTVLNLSFCGSAVSDASLRAIALHLLELSELSVRGCVRVTGAGVEAVLEGCVGLRRFDVSQCKNLRSWLAAGGVIRRGRGVKFETVADGRWRAGGRVKGSL